MNIQDITHHPYKHIIELRVKIITFYDDYGVFHGLTVEKDRGKRGKRGKKS